jgi:hypothetical protein
MYRMLESNGVLSSVYWYHPLQCLSISKGPW